MVHLYRGADGGWRVPTILFTTDPEPALPETIVKGRVLTPDEIKKSKKKVGSFRSHGPRDRAIRPLLTIIVSARTG